MSSNSTRGRLVPSAEQLIEISDAAINLVDAAGKTFLILGQDEADDLFAFPDCTFPGKIRAIERLERALNPGFFALDNPRRYDHIKTRGWPTRTSIDLRWIREMQDQILFSWPIEAICGGERVPSDDSKSTNASTPSPPTEDVRIEMPKDFPPKIDSIVSLQGMALAASRIKEAVEHMRSSGGSAADESAIQDGGQLPVQARGERLLSIQETAKRLDIDRTTLRRWRNAKPPKIPPTIFVTIGGIVKVLESKLDAWISERSEESQKNLSDA